MSAIDTRAVRNALVTHAEGLGVFQQVLAHEPKSKPGPARSLSLWSGIARPAQSGLDSTSVLWVWTGRITVSMLTEPQDDIDCNVMDAALAYLAALSGGFTLGGLARDIDLLGQHGLPLAGDMGYHTHSDTMYRAFAIQIPIVFNDVLSQVA